MRSPWSLVLAVGAVLAVAVAAGCGGGGAAAPPAQDQTDVPADAVALIGDTPILRSEFDQFFTQLEAAYNAQEREFPKTGTPEYEQLKNQAVGSLIQRVEFAREAQALGITVTEEEVTKRLDELKTQFFLGDDGTVDEAKYEAELTKQGLTEEDVRSNLEAGLVNEAIFAEVTKDVTVTDEEIRKYYDEQQDRFTTPESREVAHILVETKEEADKLYKQLENGANFAELAKKNSTDPGSAVEGGKLTDEKGSFVPEFEEVAFALKTGEIGEPVKSQFGWHIIKALGETKPEVVTPFDDVKDAIEEQLLKEKRDSVMADWVDATRAKYAPQIAYAVGFQPAEQASTDTTPTAP